MILNQIQFTKHREMTIMDDIKIVKVPIMIDYSLMDTWEDGIIYYTDGRDWEVLETCRQITNAFHKKMLAIEAQANELEAGGTVDEKPEEDGGDN